MVIEVHEDADTTGAMLVVGREEQPWSDDAAFRLAVAVAADASIDVGSLVRRRGLGGFAAQLEPLVEWAEGVPGSTDPDAIRRGSRVAETRILMGVPRPVVVGALRELPAALHREVPPTRRLEGLVTEVSRRVRRSEVANR